MDVFFNPIEVLVKTLNIQKSMLHKFLSCKWTMNKKKHISFSQISSVSSCPLHPFHSVGYLVSAAEVGGFALRPLRHLVDDVVQDHHVLQQHKIPFRKKLVIF
jgi:hypothetical protein